MKWGRWSTTASLNSTTPPDGWPEGQLPSTVNDCAREMMAQIKAGISDVQFIDLDLSPIQTGNTTFTVTGNQMAFLEYGRRVKCQVGASTLYGSVYSSTFTTNTGVSLRLDSGVLTGSLSAVSIGFPAAVNTAIPDIVFRSRPLLINGTFDIWQRGNGPFSLSALASGGGPDTWKVTLGVPSAGPVVSVTRGTNVPTIAQAGVLLTSALVISCNAAIGAISATDFVLVEHAMEGWDYKQVAQKPLTISFWVNSTLTGTYAVSLANLSADRSVAMSFSISAVSTWEKKTITFPKPPSTGTWDYSSGQGLRVRLCLAAGSNFNGGLGNWTAANVCCPASNNNFIGGTGRTFMTTGWTMDEGNASLPIQPVAYIEDLTRCRRRLQVEHGNTPRYFGNAVAPDTASVGVDFDVVMRASPSFSSTIAMTSWLITASNGIAVSVSAISLLNSSNRNAALLVKTVAAAGLSAGCGSVLVPSGGPITCMVFKAEL